MLSKDGFDKWAQEYDNDVKECYINKEYPFDGYFDVFDIILKQINSNTKVLDVGFGTGILTKKIYDLGCQVSGIDFSEKMVLISQEKMPKAQFYQQDFNDELSEILKREKFDYIISTYAMHHLDDHKKVDFIFQLSNMLSEGGKIIIGDISFIDDKNKEMCKRNAKDGWDDDEIYIVADKILPLLKEKGLIVKYTQVSSCSGILYATK